MDENSLLSQLSKWIVTWKGHTADVESCRIETEPDIDHIFSDFPDSIVPFVEGIEGVPESHTITSVFNRAEGHADVQDKDCGEHENHELPEHRS